MKWVSRIALGFFFACVILLFTSRSNFDESEPPAPTPEPSVADVSLSEAAPPPSNDAVTTPETPADIALNNPVSAAPPPYSPLMTTEPIPDNSDLINPMPLGSGVPSAQF